MHFQVLLSICYYNQYAQKKQNKQLFFLLNLLKSKIKWFRKID